MSSSPSTGRSRATSSISSNSATPTTSASWSSAPARPSRAWSGSTRSRASPSGSRSPRPCSTASAPATTTAPSASSTSCPRGCDESLYLKDDDYRLSFLYGNFTTLTRFTELDAERILTERLGPLFVSIHSTDPELRAHMLRNPKGATSLRWLKVLLDGGIEVHGQVVVCPGVNDGDALEDTLAGILDQYPKLATVGVVPLGISQFSKEAEMRAHTTEEAAFVVDTVAEWQKIYRRTLGRRLVYAADEYYLLAERPFPTARAYDEFPQHENGIGMARAFVDAFANPDADGPGRRAPRLLRLGRCRPGRGLPGPPDGPDRARDQPPARPPMTRPVTVLTGTYGARILAPWWRSTRATTSAFARSPTTSSAATSAWPGCSPARTSPGPWRRARPRCATSCPTPASTRAASSTG